MMLGVTTAETMLETYRRAELAVLKGQSYRLGDRQLTRADLAEIRAGRAEWERAVARERNGGGVRYQLADFSQRRDDA